MRLSSRTHSEPHRRPHHNLLVPLGFLTILSVGKLLSVTSAMWPCLAGAAQWHASLDPNYPGPLPHHRRFLIGALAACLRAGL